MSNLSKAAENARSEDGVHLIPLTLGALVFHPQYATFLSGKMLVDFFGCMHSSKQKNMMSLFEILILSVTT